jgi:hypothetical protein
MEKRKRTYHPDDAGAQFWDEVETWNRVQEFPCGAISFPSVDPISWSVRQLNANLHDYPSNQRAS